MEALDLRVAILSKLYSTITGITIQIKIDKTMPISNADLLDGWTDLPEFSKSFGYNNYFPLPKYSKSWSSLQVLLQESKILTIKSFWSSTFGRVGNKIIDFIPIYNKLIKKTKHKVIRRQLIVCI